MGTQQIRRDLVTELALFVRQHGANINYRRFTAPDGRAFELRVRVLPDVTLHDGDEWYGTLEWTNGPHDPRPAHFDGRASVVARGKMHERLWWQPPADVACLFELARIRERVRAYYANEWHHLEVSIRAPHRPCGTCGHLSSVLPLSRDYSGMPSCAEFVEVYGVIDTLLTEVNV